MIEQSITYKDYNGDTRTEVFSFHIDKADMVEMEANSPGGVKEYYNRLLREKDNAKIYATFKEILLKSIGKRSEDGRRFIRDQETRDEFTQTNAFGDFILTLGNDAELAAKFMNGLFPEDLMEEAAGEAKKEKRYLNEFTPEEIASMPKEQFETMRRRTSMNRMDQAQLGAAFMRSNAE